MTTELGGLTDFAAFKAALKSAGAGYVVLCKATEVSRYEIVGDALQNGEPVDFLRPVAFANPDLLVFEVLPEALDP
jgi:hypothetical protein